MNIAAETQNLTKTYKNTIAVSEINLAVPMGAVCGFLGKNGAGKTTTMKMLVGLIKPTSGSFSIMGKTADTNSLVGYLADVPEFYGYMTAVEFLTLCGKIAKVSDLKNRVEELLKKVGLMGVKTKISGYSRGMRQRLGIAQAIINRPNIVFLDEPISALDPAGRRDVTNIINDLGTTVMFSTHILSDVENICNYIIIMDKGKILEQGWTAEVKQKYSKNAVQLAFFDVADKENFIAKNADFNIKNLADPTAIEIVSDNVSKLSQTIVAALAQLSLPIRNFSVFESTLDSIFYDLTEISEISKTSKISKEVQNV
ncbi:MAG: ABC transporter ATP-binding protein [Defluviitaleaceae bacterium]|nr:ABC transporter ATP-binding protein [Defluviitaleaceae bacterium]